MNCRDADNLIQESLDRPLSAQDRDRLDAHLQTCPACAKIWTEYRQIARTTRAWLDTASGESQDDIKERVLAQIAASPAPATRCGQAKTTLAWTLLAAAAIAASGAFAFVPVERIPDDAHTAFTLPSLMTILGGDMAALRHFGDTLQQPPIVPVSSLLCTVTLISAIAANVFLAQRAAKRREAA
jgi:anti-sigma factor RsiW